MTLYRIITSIMVLILLTDVSIAEDPQPASTASIPTIAVHTLEARGISEDEAATLSDVLRSKLMNTRKYVVMERGQMEAILEEQAFQQSGVCTDKECMVEMGQVLGIQQIIAGSIGKVGRAYSINIRVISVETGKITRSVTHNYTGPIENLLTTEMSVVAKRLSGVETTYKPRASKKRKHDKKRRKRNIIITGLSVVAVGGGAAAILLLKGEDKEETASLEVIWDQP